MSDHWYSLLSPGTWLSGMASVSTSTQVPSNGFYNQGYSNAKSTLLWYWFSRGIEVECNKEMDRRPELGCSPYGFILIRDPLGFRKDSAIPKNVSANSTWWEKNTKSMIRTNRKFRSYTYSIFCFNIRWRNSRSGRIDICPLHFTCDLCHMTKWSIPRPKGNGMKR